MKKLSVVSFLIVMLFLVGCATTFRPWQLSNIHEGMDKAAVVKLLGNPDQVTLKDHAEYLYYSYTEGQLPEPPSSADSLIHGLSTKNRQNRFKIHRYVVMLADGKVVNYKEVQN